MSRFATEKGFALLISVIVLALFCLIGFYLAINAATVIRISDNYEAEVHARFAAYAGLDHARAAFRGLSFDDQLRGPDGRYDDSTGYMNQARSFPFRNPVDWSVAQALDIFDPRPDVGGTADDGILNTGLYRSIPGTALIPATGAALSAPGPEGSGGAVIARYFVKITDNNGEPSERAGDPLDNPFIDGDGAILARSVGIAPSIRGHSAGAGRNNSVVVFEGRFRRLRAFDLDAPLVVQGISARSSATLMFEGDAFLVQGGTGDPGIAVLDADRSDGISPLSEIASQIAPGQEFCVQGQGPLPSLRDLTSTLESDPSKALLLNKDFLWDFTRRRVKKLADSSFHGDQDWTMGNAPDLGFYDLSEPMNAPGQRPRITLVDGNLAIGGSAAGAGLLVVTGKLSAVGPFAFTGLALVAGAGELDAPGAAWTLTGGVYIASVAPSGSSLNWGAVRLSLRGSGAVIFSRAAIRMALALIPPDQVGFREITSSLDP